jgi:hypothetical protein
MGGLSLEEGKTVLRQVQARIIQMQGRGLGSRSQEMRAVSAKSARQGSTNPVCANGFWRSSSVLPPLSPLHLSRRKKNHCMAAPFSAAAGYNAGAATVIHLDE